MDASSATRAAPPLPGPLVSAAWLGAHLSDALLRLADVRWALATPSGRERYAAGHLPGAIFLDLDTDLSAPPGSGPGRHPLPSSADLADALGSRGIGDAHAVVAYDDAGGSVAARLWWLCRHYGHPGQVAILDGGIQAWVAAGGPLTGEEPRHPRARWSAGAARNDVVNAAQVARLAADPDALLVDARSEERFRGEVEPIDPRAGHIPGARSAPWAANLGADGRFLPPEALRRRYHALGADGGRRVVAYCGSGTTAAHDILAMELAGIDAELYEGSWSDWSSDPGRPAAFGPRP